VPDKKKLKPTTGKWVSGASFFDRENEMRLFIKKLKDKTHLRLVAQRRVGKTSLMKEAGKRLGSNYISLYIDLEDSDTAADAIVELSIATKQHKSLWQKVTSVFPGAAAYAKGHLEELSVYDFKVKLRAEAIDDWKTKGDMLLQILASQEKSVVIFMDELPILVNNMLKGRNYEMTEERRRRADQFMSWLRKKSIEYQDKLTFVISGSIGIEPVLQQADLSHTINTFGRFELKAWDKDTAYKCVRSLAEYTGLKLEEGVEEQIVKRLGSCIPGHLQMFFDEIYNDCQDRKSSKCTKKDVNRVYTKEMFSNRAYVEMSTYEERLKQVFGPKKMSFVLDLLTEAAVEKSLTIETTQVICRSHVVDGETCEAILPQTLEILKHDGYLKMRGDKYVFDSHLVRDWWKAHFGYTHTPAAKRG
jgi:uncharacterized protein